MRGVVGVVVFVVVGCVREDRVTWWVDVTTANEKKVNFTYYSVCCELTFVLFL